MHAAQGGGKVAHTSAKDAVRSAQACSTLRRHATMQVVAAPRRMGIRPRPSSFSLLRRLVTLLMILRISSVDSPSPSS